MDATTDNKPGATLDGAFQVGDLRVDPQAGDVIGPAGREQLDPKVMGVLVMLAERAGHVVPRDELLARLWPGAVVTDDALTRCLYELRRQMNAAAGSAEFRTHIETLPKRGYRLNAAIKPILAAAPPPAVAPRRGRARLVAGVALFVLAAIVAAFLYAGRPPPESRIAVLPFLDLSDSQDQGFLADGIAEEILNRLTGLGDLKVIARTSSFAFRGKNADVAEIARKLAVTHVLEGSVRTSGGRIRVTAQLIATADSAHIWSETYERSLDDVFAVQDEIANAVANQLEARVAGVRPRHTTTSVDALVQYAQGEYFYYRRAQDDIGRAVRAYEAAVAIDPSYAQAWAALAGAYSVLAFDFDPPNEALRVKQRDAALRAVELDPKLGLAHFRLGQYYFEEGLRDSGRKHWAIAAELDPGNPLIIGTYADHAVDRGDLEAAIAYMQRAVAADPLAALYRTNLAAYLQADGQYEAALKEYESIRESMPGMDSENALDTTRMLVLLGRHADAAAHAAAMPAGHLKDNATSLLIGTPGMREAADAALARLAGTQNDIALQDEILDSVRLAEAYALRGRIGDAFDALEGKKRALQGRGGAYAGYIWYLRHESVLSPFLKPLRSNPRWKAFVSDVESPRADASGNDGRPPRRAA